MALLPGCGDGRLATYPAGGTLKLTDGKPLTGCTVVLRTTSGPKPVSSRADVKEDGSFTISTFEAGDGAAEGEHQVSLIPPPMSPELDRDEVRAPPPPFDFKYGDFKTSGLVVTVTRDETKNQFDLVVEPYREAN